MKALKVSIEFWKSVFDWKIDIYALTDCSAGLSNCLRISTIMLPVLNPVYLNSTWSEIVSDIKNDIFYSAAFTAQTS